MALPARQVPLPPGQAPVFPEESRRRPRPLEVLAPLAPLVPGGLVPGTTVGVGGGPGATSLLLALVAGPSRSGCWCAAVGLPRLGARAAAELGVDLGRMVLVPRPGDRWAAAAATLVDSLDLVVLSPPLGAPAALCRRLGARARSRGAVLVVFGQGGEPVWGEPPDLSLVAARAQWVGLGEGHGLLGARRLRVVSRGRRSFSGERTAWLWLPGPPGGPAQPGGLGPVAGAGPKGGVPGSGA